MAKVDEVQHLLSRCRGQLQDCRTRGTDVGRLLCCSCVHVGVELETCAELVLSAADATAKPTATNAKMVSLNAIPAQRPEQPAAKTEAQIASNKRSSEVTIEVTSCLRPCVAKLLALRSSEQRGCSATGIASACPTQSAMRQWRQ